MINTLHLDSQADYSMTQSYTEGTHPQTSCTSDAAIPLTSKGSPKAVAMTTALKKSGSKLWPVDGKTCTKSITLLGKLLMTQRPSLRTQTLLVSIQIPTTLAQAYLSVKFQAVLNFKYIACVGATIYHKNHVKLCENFRRVWWILFLSKVADYLGVIGQREKAYLAIKKLVPTFDASRDCPQYYK